MYCNLLEINKNQHEFTGEKRNMSTGLLSKISANSTHKINIRKYTWLQCEIVKYLTVTSKCWRKVENTKPIPGVERHDDNSQYVFSTISTPFHATVFSPTPYLKAHVHWGYGLLVYCYAKVVQPQITDYHFQKE